MPTGQNATMSRMLEVLYDNTKIKALMLDRGLAGNALGRMAGISGPSMHDILSGKTKVVRQKTLMGIANALDVPIKEIIKVKGGKGDAGDVLIEAIGAFNQLSTENQAAMLAAMRHLAAQQKKRK